MMAAEAVRVEDSDSDQSDSTDQSVPSDAKRVDRGLDHSVVLAHQWPRYQEVQRALKYPTDRAFFHPRGQS